MSLAILDRPEDPVALARWLESQLVGTGLADVAAELAAVYGTPPGSRLTATEQLGPILAEVLARGLRALTAEKIQELLRHPEVLLDLQEQILIEGGPYWQRQIDRLGEYETPVERSWEKLQASLAEQPSPASPPSSSPHRRRFGFWSVGLGFATAASVFVAIYASGVLSHPTSSAPTPEWGWNRPDAFAMSDPPRVYLNHLADTADEWFQKVPEDSIGLARRIGQMREGCSALLLADHAPLSPADRDWLKERCRKWATAIDGELSALEAGRDPKTVRTEMDAIIHKLGNALRERATQAA